LLVDAVGVNVDDDGLTKDVDEDEVGNLVDDNCCGIDVDDGKLVGVVARPDDDDVAGKLVGVVALATDGVVVAAADVVVGGGMPDFLTVEGGCSRDIPLTDGIPDGFLIPDGIDDEDEDGDF